MIFEKQYQLRDHPQYYKLEYNEWKSALHTFFLIRNTTIYKKRRALLPGNISSYSLKLKKTSSVFCLHFSAILNDFLSIFGENLKKLFRNILTYKIIKILRNTEPY